MTTLPVRASTGDSDVNYRPLGYSGSLYYVMSGAKKQIQGYGASTLMSITGCLDIVNDIDYWRAYFGRPGNEIDWRAAGSHVMKQCIAAGMFDETRVRACGVWTDDGRTILHTGSTIYVDGVRANPAQIESEHLYHLRPPMIRTWDGSNPGEFTGYGQMIRNASLNLHWEHPAFADLFAGWIATAPLCGALDIPDHVWLIDSYRGPLDLAKACLGTLAVQPTGNITERLIRDFVGNDARPIIFDHDDFNVSKAPPHRAFTRLLRQAKTATGMRSIRKVADKGVATHTLRSSIMVSSGNAPDDSGGAVVLRCESEGGEHHKVIPADTPQRLLMHQVRHLRTIRHNINVFRNVVGVGSRAAEQSSVLLAGAWSLLSTDPIDHDTAEMYLAGYNWGAVPAVETRKALPPVENNLLEAMLAHTVRVEMFNGMPERSIGELFEIAIGRLVDPRITVTLAREVLLRNGMKPERNEGMWVSVRHRPFVRSINLFDHGNRWRELLIKLPNAKRSDIEHQFGKTVCHGTFIPTEDLIREIRS